MGCSALSSSCGDIVRKLGSDSQDFERKLAQIPMNICLEDQILTLIASIVFIHLIYVIEIFHAIVGFNNNITAMMWISFILTAGTSENGEENVQRENDVEADIINH